MNKKFLNLYISIGLFIIFIVFTATLFFVDMGKTGVIDPETLKESNVAYSTINLWFHNLTGVNFTIYNLTDWGSYPVILMALGFGLLGIIQWIMRKHILKVDKELFVLGVFYIVVFIVYLIFEFVVVNRRPVLIENKLEASYPSSTTVLSLTFLISAFVPVNKYVKIKGLRYGLYAFLIAYIVFLAGGRLICGVHWLTDIIGGYLISASLICLYYFFINLLCRGDVNGTEKE